MMRIGSLITIPRLPASPILGPANCTRDQQIGQDRDAKMHTLRKTNPNYYLKSKDDQNVHQTPFGEQPFRFG